MFTKPDYLDQLIDKAAAKCGSDYQLSKVLGVSRSTVSQWRTAKKSCPVADQVLMADIAGLEGVEWVARALIAQYQGTTKADMLKSALKKALVVTGAGLATSGAFAAESVFYFIRCIFCLPKGNVNRKETTVFQCFS